MTRSNDENTNGRAETSPADKHKLGTFEGVFTPSILTILGVIMFLRFGWVVGNVGLIGTLIIVTICKSVTFLTGMSMSSIATDRKVGTGGAYYMISRSLGPEIGGAIGIPLYFALAFSVPLYTIGFAESISSVLPDADPRIVGLIATLAVALLAVKSAKVAIRFQYFIMAAIAFALISLLLGKSVEPTEIEILGASPEKSENFWIVLAVFFPAVTGIEAGINMSGDLKNPSRSLPFGTLSAILVGYIVYMGLPVILAMRADAETLIENPMIMREIARWGNAILLGVWGATLSSAIGSILGAPRVLQALAGDGVLPRRLRFLGKGSGPANLPRWGTLITLAVALVLVWTTNLNTIAPVLTMFFLTTYMVLNLAAGLERFLGNPSFRPAFRVHWVFSFLGALLCLIVMFMINMVAAAIAMVTVLVVYVWLQKREMKSTWGDVRRGLWMMVLRLGLLQLDDAPDLRNWRPNVLVFSGAPKKRWHLILFADLMTHGRGLITVASVLPKELDDAERRTSLESAIRDHLTERGIQALVRLISAPDVFTGAAQLVASYGLGQVIPNTILLGDTEGAGREHRQKYCDMVAGFHRAQRNVVIFRENETTPVERTRDNPPERIDVWWGGLKGNGSMMLILADMLKANVLWQNARLCLKLVVKEESGMEAARQNLYDRLEAMRIDAECEVIEAQGRNFDDIFRESSADADIIFRGLAVPDENFSTYYNSTRQKISGMPTTVLVLARRDFDFLNVLQKTDE